MNLKTFGQSDLTIWWGGYCTCSYVRYLPFYALRSDQHGSTRDHHKPTESEGHELTAKT